MFTPEAGPVDCHAPCAFSKKCKYLASSTTPLFLGCSNDTRRFLVTCVEGNLPLATCFCGSQAQFPKGTRFQPRSCRRFSLPLHGSTRPFHRSGFPSRPAKSPTFIGADRLKKGLCLFFSRDSTVISPHRSDPRTYVPQCPRLAQWAATRRDLPMPRRAADLCYSFVLTNRTRPPLKVCKLLVTLPLPSHPFHSRNRSTFGTRSL